MPPIFIPPRPGIVPVVDQVYMVPRPNSSPVGVWRGLAWSPTLKLFAAVGNSSTFQCMTTDDSVTWTGRVLASQNWEAICWAEDRFVCVSQNGTSRAASSTDAATWTLKPLSSAKLWAGICYADALDLVIAVARTSDQSIARSPSRGDSWAVTTLGGASGFDHVAYSPALNQIIATGNNANDPWARSSDGIVWTTFPAPLGGVFRKTLTWAPELNRWAAISTLGPIWSDDGITWTPGSGIVNQSWQSCCWCPELQMFIAVNSNGLAQNTAAFSNDGKVWQMFGQATGTWQAVAWAGEPLNLAVSITTGSAVQASCSRFHLVQQ